MNAGITGVDSHAQIHWLGKWLWQAHFQALGQNSEQDSFHGTFILKMGQ
jgi:hypothetical protein